VGDTQFVSSSGRGDILAACYAPVPCSTTASISSRGSLVATTSPRQLGIDELGDVAFRLTPAGQAMLAQARGNRLGVQVTLSSGSATATGQVALARYGQTGSGSSSGQSVRAARLGAGRARSPLWQW
jgi:hypothetical protein